MREKWQTMVLQPQVEKLLLSLGASLYGVADISELKKSFSLNKKVIGRISRAVCFGVRLSNAVVEEIETHPTLNYYHHYRRINNLLDDIALKLTNCIQEYGFYAYPVPASLIADWQTQRADVSHKHIAVLAGLGWFGRSNLVVTEKFASRVRFASVLTDMPLNPAKPLERDCGSCKACINLCPAEAIKLDKGQFEHIKCFEKLKEFRQKGYASQYICGICLKACLPETAEEKIRTDTVRQSIDF